MLGMKNVCNWRQSGAVDIRQIVCVFLILVEILYIIGLIWQWTCNGT